jgi:hypothetical protein
VTECTDGAKTSLIPHGLPVTVILGTPLPALVNRALTKKMISRFTPSTRIKGNP